MRRLLVLLIVLLSLGHLTHAQTMDLATDFTYQGYLEQDSLAVNATCGMRFALFDAITAGNQIGTTKNLSSVLVSNGVFTVNLDFGVAAFNGADRYLRIAVDCGTGYQTLAPRQALTPVPYALGLYGLRTIPNATSANIIGGYYGNGIATNVVGATISGGGVSENLNRINDNYGTVGGGIANTIGLDDGNVTTSAYATIGGGQSNSATGSWSTIGGGVSNSASNSYATIGGGNTNTASGSHAQISGGYNNTAGGSYGTIGGGKTHQASGNWSTIGGGDTNIASAQDSTVGGGYSNKATGSESTVGGGISNEANGYSSVIAGGYNGTANGNYSAILGGQNGVADGLASVVFGGSNNHASGDYSIAMGVNANALDAGSMVFGTSPDVTISSQGESTFTALTENGFYIYTDTNLSVGTAFVDGGWSRTSDRNTKEHFTLVDTQAVLASVATMPITTWNYINDENETVHMGVMSQDFYAAFGLGDDERHINDIDADGVLFASIQALYEQNQALNAQNQAQDAQIRQLESRLSALEAASNAKQDNNLLLIVVLALLAGFTWWRWGGSR